MYWSTDAIYQTDIFPSVLSRDRYMLLLRFLHFADNAAVNVSDSDHDRLWKIRQLTDTICQQCKVIYSLACNLCVDESLLLFKGRLGIKQFSKSKRARFGIKLFELRTKAGILLDLMVYTGRDMNKELITDPELLTSGHITATLIQPYLNKGHRLFFDSFYICPRLALYLFLSFQYLAISVYFTQTCRLPGPPGYVFGTEFDVNEFLHHVLHKLDSDARHVTGFWWEPTAVLLTTTTQVTMTEKKMSFYHADNMAVMNGLLDCCTHHVD